jgi:hypothetical protein
VRLAHALTIFLACLLGRASFAGSLHPQDGPHADLRVAIEGRQVRFSVGVNLAFLDETIDVPREALNELSEAESERVLEVLRGYLIKQAPCIINGDRVEPAFERLEMFTHPDPGMMAIFPKMGARALIRATVVMRFDAPSEIETVELTWPAYPYDLLAEEMEQASAVRARMYFEAVLTANGKTEPARFTHAEPTLRWSRSDTETADPLRDLPAPVIADASEGSVFTRIVVIALVLTLAGAVVTAKKNAKLARTLGAAGLLAAATLVYQVAVAPGLRPPPPPLLTESEAERVLLALHERLYRAFDYTAESDIYDHLAFAIEGDLLGELYEQIRLSLLQAEEEMKVGVVTGLEPIETSVLEIDDAGEDPVGRGFLMRHRWRVDGTVYHWGHSHTRAHIYEADYRVRYTQDGWKLTAHGLRSQQRIDPDDGSLFNESESIQEQLEDLGLPDI